MEKEVLIRALEHVLQRLKSPGCSEHEKNQLLEGFLTDAVISMDRTHAETVLAQLQSRIFVRR